jgi:cytochrome P450
VGSDTTAIALRAVFYFLMKNPRCYEKLLEEVLINGDEISPVKENVSYSESAKLPYL